MQRSLLPTSLNTPTLLSSLSANGGGSAGFNAAANGDAAQASSFSRALREARSPSPVPAPATPERTASAEPAPTPAQREPERNATATERHGPAAEREPERIDEEDSAHRRAATAPRRPGESAGRRPAAAARGAARESTPAQPSDASTKSTGSSCTAPAEAGEPASGVDPKHRALAAQDGGDTALVDPSLPASADIGRQAALRDDSMALPEGSASGRAGRGAGRASADAGADANLLEGTGTGAGTRARTLAAISAASPSGGALRASGEVGSDLTPLSAAAGEPAREGIGELTSASNSTPMLPALAGASALGGAQGSGTATGGLSEALVHAAPGSEDFAQELAGQVSYFVREGVQQARLQLNPQDLGPVLVRIQLEGQTAQVHMAAELQPTRQALEQALPALASQLSEAGITLTGGGVFEQRPGNHFGAGDGPPERQQDRDRAIAGASRGSAGALAEPAPARWERARGIVDLVA